MPKSRKLHTNIIQLSLSPEALRHLEHMAKLAGMNRSEYIRSLIHADFRTTTFAGRPPRP